VNIRSNMSAKAKQVKVRDTQVIDIDQIEPLDSRILVKRLDTVTVNRLIIIPDAYRQKSGRGVVLATGPGKFLYLKDKKKVRRPMGVKPGEVVVFGAQWDDLEGKLGDGYALIQEDDVLYKDLSARTDV
jgi:co-chaperonin GroES (HSP10)